MGVGRIAAERLASLAWWPDNGASQVRGRGTEMLL